MNITVNEELKAYIDLLTPDEHDALERSILAERHAHAIAATTNNANEAASTPAPANTPQPNPLKSRADIAKAARLSSTQVVQIEKIQKQAAPELVAAIKAGAISINAAAAVASLSTEEQKTAALGGRDELKQAAKRVREVSRKPRPENDKLPAPSPDDVQSLQERVIALTAENQALRAQVAELQAHLTN